MSDDARADLAAVAATVFARAGIPVRPGEMDGRLAAIAAGAAELFTVAVEQDDGLPVALLSDLVTVTAALRAVLGYVPGPVNAELYWSPDFWRP